MRHDDFAIDTLAVFDACYFALPEEACHRLQLGVHLLDGLICLAFPAIAQQRPVVEVVALGGLWGGIGEIADALCSIRKVDVALQPQMGEGRHRIGSVWHAEDVGPEGLADALALPADLIKGGIPLAASHLPAFPYGVEIVGYLRLFYSGEGFDVLRIFFYPDVIEQPLACVGKEVDVALPTGMKSGDAFLQVAQFLPTLHLRFVGQDVLPKGWVVLDKWHDGFWPPLNFYVEDENFQSVGFCRVECLVDVRGGFGPYHYGIESSLSYVSEAGVVVEFRR